MRRDRPVRSGRGDRARSRARHRSCRHRSRGAARRRRRRCAAAKRDSPCSAPMPPPPSSKAPRASPRTLCAANGIPTADYVRVDTAAAAHDALKRFGIPVVIKADGLAAGKGVTVAMTRDEAEAAIDAAGDGPMVIEEFLEGEEASLFALGRRRDGDPARLGPGPQARRRRRYRARTPAAWAPTARRRS